MFLFLKSNGKSTETAWQPILRRSLFHSCTQENLLFEIIEHSMIRYGLIQAS